ncbi:MAG TPA: S8 family peptidase [Pyrinomonadaceae bacterium]|jgi:subtilisin family serine protease|nr:S8 family peptidase [Pyrinomonadaceae bacterium]
MRKLYPRLSSGLFSLALFALALSAASSAAAQAPQAAAGRLKIERFKSREVVAGQVLVRFRESADAQEVERAKRAADVEHERKVGGRGARLLQSRTKDAETLVRELSARPDVLYAEPNYVIRATAAPDDPRFGEQWALQNTGYTSAAGAGTPGADIGAVRAWDISTGTRDNVVAVVDTGIDYNHPDLAANVWSAPAPFTVNIAGQSVNCAAGTHGFDALANTCDPLDDHNHGTHVAGIAGAVGSNGLGVSGVSQRASIMGLRFLDAEGNGTLEGAVNAIEFAVQAKQAFGPRANVRVLSNSWGWAGDASQALLDQINRAAESDMLFVAGAGNDGTDNDTAPFYPAAYDAASVLSVAATDNNDALVRTPSWGSNYGRKSVDLAAPGNLILSTTVGGSYDWFSGTSMAAPHVSGAAALVLSRCALDTAGLKNALLGNVDQVASLTGLTATGGRLNVGKALASCTTATPTPTPSPTPTPTATPTPSPTPSATASGTGTSGRLSKWIDGVGTLGDSSVSDVGGLIGIGTASPTQRLDVVGNGKYFGPAGSWVMGTAHHVFISDDGSPVGFQNTRPDAGSGAQMFDHTGAMKAFFQWHNVNAPNGNSLNFATVLNDPITFTTNTYNARMTITGPGNVGIGTTTPQSALQVNGYIQLALTSGAPPAADCDAAAEYGRMKVDAVGVRVYVCTSAGWKSTALQ